MSASLGRSLLPSTIIIVLALVNSTVSPSRGPIIISMRSGSATRLPVSTASTRLLHLSVGAQVHHVRSDTENCRILEYLNSIDPNIKFTIESPNEQGAIPFLDTFPKPSGNNITTSIYRKPTHTDRYLGFNSKHPKTAKRAVVRALTDRAKNVCSSPELLAEEMGHLGKVLR